MLKKIQHFFLPHLKCRELLEAKEADLKKLSLSLQDIQEKADNLLKQNQELEINSRKILSNEQLLRKSFEKIKASEAEIKLKTIELEEKNVKILIQNEELYQTQEELIAQRDFIEKQKQELERGNRRMSANEKILAKSFEKIKASEAEIKLKTIELEEKNVEILTQNEELHQTQEELIAQRDFIEKQKEELERSNRRMSANEKILAKSFEKIKASEAEIKLKTIELEERNAEIIAQNEELFQTQEELIAQREFIKKQNDDLQEYNLKMRNSIQAAQLIQQAILPSETAMMECFPHYFLLNRPRDVVSGDFWWLHKTEHHKMLIVADCTGHGVSGAFMTMIGSTLLDKIIKMSNIHDPAQILETLHQEIYNALKQGQTNNNNGMDMSVISLETTSREETKITFAGAKHSLYCINATQNTQLLEIKGTRKGIGGFQNPETEFENHSLFLPRGSWLYVGTDGIVDQNNFYRKKIGEKMLKEILLVNHHLAAQEQKLLLEKLLENHSQNTEQRDDILFIGLQIT